MIGKGGEYLPRLWTDKPVTLGERTQQIKKGKRESSLSNRFAKEVTLNKKKKGGRKEKSTRA